GLYELLERRDFGAQLVALLRVADRARPVVDLDVADARHEVVALAHDRIGAVEVMVLREIQARRIEHEREALVAVRRRERAVDRDRAMRALERLLALLELDRNVTVDEIAARGIDAELGEDLGAKRRLVDQREVRVLVLRVRGL